MLPIRILTVQDLPAFADHHRRHGPESGQNGDPVFMPYGQSSPLDVEAMVERRARKWKIEVGAPDWQRSWAVFDDDRIVGHVELGADFLETALHRAGLGMGLERPYRKQGLGRALLETAIEFGRTQPFLTWIDLGVFEANAPARALYEAHGFVQTGCVQDRFRVDGQSIADVQMSLRVDD